MTEAQSTIKVSTASRRLAQFIVLTITAVTISIGNVAETYAEDIDPTDLWFRAYLLLKEGEALESTDTLATLNKYNESKMMLDGLASNHPQFHTDIVLFRRKELAEKIPVLKQMLKDGIRNGVPQANTPSVGAVAGNLPPTQAPREFTNTDPNLPSWQEPGTLPDRRPQQGPKIISPPGTPSQSTLTSNGSGVTQQRAEFPPVTQPSDQNIVSPIDPVDQIRQKYRQQDEKISQLTQLNLSLQSQIAARQQNYAQMEREVEAARQKVDQLRKEKEQAEAIAAQNQDAVAEAARLRELYGEALAEWENSLALNEKIVAEKKEMEREIQVLLEEKAQVEKERDQLRAIVDISGDGAKAQIARLTQDNEELRKKLDETRVLAERLAKENADRSEEVAERDLMIVSLKERVTEIDNERKRLILENENYEATIDELKTQLQGLANGTISPDAITLATTSPQIGSENVLLRNVVLRQIRRQNQIKQSRDLLIEELNRIGPEAQNLLTMVDDMFHDGGLTPAEKEMFRDDPEALAIVEASPTESEEIGLVVEGGIIERQNIQDELDQINKVAQLAFMNKEYAEAESEYRKYLSYRPRSAEGFTNLALVKMKTNRLDEAVPLLEKAISIKSDYSHAYYILGKTLHQQGKPDEALVRLQESIQHDPKHSRAFNCVGVISSEKGLLVKAETAFIEAVTIDPEYADAHFNLAVLYATRDEPDAEKAGNHYSRAVDLGAQRDGAIEQFLSASVSVDTVEPAPAPISAAENPIVISSIQ